jgi:hypothetical protein
MRQFIELYIEINELIILDIYWTIYNFPNYYFLILIL